MAAVAILLLAVSCTPSSPIVPSAASDSISTLPFPVSGWKTNFQKHSAPYKEFLSGGPAKNGIPAIETPIFVSVQEAGAWLADREPVQVVNVAGDVRAYPQQILIWHQIVNDTVGSQPVLITFSPISSTTSAFKRTIDDQVLVFGTAGVTRKSNIVLFDQQTESWWQEFGGEAIVGNLTGKQLEALPMQIVSWRQFKTAFPDGKVLSRQTGFARPYGQTPYVLYDTEGTPQGWDGTYDRRVIPIQERVLGIHIGQTAMAIPYPKLATKPVIQISLGGVELVAFHQKGMASPLDSRTISDGRDIGSTGVFERTLQGKLLSFHWEDASFVDEETNSTWNIFGHALSGPLAGQQLAPAQHQGVLWFVWSPFMPQTAVYGK